MLATVIAGKVEIKDRLSMIDPLERFVRKWKNGLRPMKMKRVGSKARAAELAMAKGYRQLSLTVWELKRAEETWG